MAALYAESLMMLTPWSWYGKNKQPHANTRCAIDVIRRALAAAPQHPGLIHFLIHATEQGPDATWAEAPADRLGAISPGLPHLVHMPSHTYIRVGRYGDAARVNQRALEADVALAAAMTRLYGRIPARPLRLGVQDESSAMMAPWFQWNLKRSFVGRRWRTSSSSRHAARNTTGWRRGASS